MLLDETEAFIESQPNTPANGYGYRTVASAYRGMAEALDELTPPSALRIQHGALVAEAGAIADEATRISSMATFDRTGPGLGLIEQRRALRESVEVLD